MAYICSIHGIKGIDWCDECKKLLKCDCSKIIIQKIKDIKYDCEVGKKLVTIKIIYCATCGEIYNVVKHKHKEKE